MEYFKELLFKKNNELYVLNIDGFIPYNEISIKSPKSLNTSIISYSTLYKLVLHSYRVINSLFISV